MRASVRDLYPPLGFLPPFQSCSERQVCFIEGRWRSEWFSKISVNYLLGAQTVPDKPEDLLTDFSSGKKEKSSVDICYCLMNFVQALKMVVNGKL